MSSRDRVRSGRRPALGAILAALLVALPAVASAGHGGREIGSFLSCDRPVTPPRCTSVGNNLLHYVAFDPALSEGLAEAMRHTMDEVYGPTRLIMREQDEVTASTDVIVFSGDYGENGAAGWVYCPADAPKGVNVRGDRWCRHQEMHFNVNPRYAAFFDDEGSRRHVTCHELGHTLGLHHWGNPPQSDGPVGATCMNANTPNGPTSLDPTDVDHIDAYPYSQRTRAPGLRIAEAPGGPPTLASTAGSVEASGMEAPTALPELVAASDAVVRGRIIEVAEGRTFGPVDRPFHYAAATVRVDTLLAGALAGDRPSTTLMLEIPLFGGPGELEALRPALLGSDRILFLRNKGASAAAAGMSLAEQRADADFYGLVTFGAEIVQEAGRALVGPDGAVALRGTDGCTLGEVEAEIASVER